MTVIGNPSEDDLKKLAKINLRLLDIQNEVNEVKGREENLVNEVKAIIGNLNAIINSIGSEQGVRAELKDAVKARVNELRELVTKVMGNLSGLSVDKAYEALKTLNDNVTREANRLRRELEVATSILLYAHEYSTLTMVLSKISQLINGGDSKPKDEANINVLDSIIELLSKDSLEDLEIALSEYEGRVKEARARLMDYINKAKTKVTKMINSINWLKYRGLLNQDVHIPSLDSMNLNELRVSIENLVSINKLIISKLSEVSSRLNVPLNVLAYIASNGPNVGLDEVVMARELGMESRVIVNYLEILWRAKLVEKRYVS
jgi:ElaB/YqjD/DUF883 family membrane-anchored ribosome-binding protein